MTQKQLVQRKIEEYKEKFANPYVARSRGMVDDVIDPRDTRIKLIQGLDMLANKHETRPEKSTVIFLYNSHTSLATQKLLGFSLPKK